MVLVVAGAMVGPAPALARPAAPDQEDVTAAASTCRRTTSDPVGEFPNPLHRCATADPGIHRVGTETWYSYATGGRPDRGVFPIRKTTDNRRTWTRAGHIFPAGQVPSWTTDHGFTPRYWAPQVTTVGGRYVAYYSARGGLFIAIGVATAENPDGPWTDHGPIIRGAGFSVIDPYFFRDPRDSKNYLLFKYNVNPRQPTWIVIRELTADGLGPLPDSTDQPLIRNDRDWEGQVVESPAMEFRNDKYFLFYSGNRFRSKEEEPSRYAVGVARSDRATGGFDKNPDNPILHGDGRFKDPGGQDVVRGPNPDEWIMFYHADPLFAPFDGGRARFLMMDTIKWDGDGWPHVNDRTPSD
jgi:beta-xylosidase